MRLFAVSILSVLTVLPAYSVGNLPVVNVGAGSVSARAEFGEPIINDAVIETKTIKTIEYKPIELNPVVRKTDIVEVAKTNFATSDEELLIPSRPRGDLWARNSDADNFVLPEESLDIVPYVAPVQPIVQNNQDDAIKIQDMQDMYAEITQMIDDKKQELEKLELAQMRDISKDRVRFERVPVVKTTADVTKSIAAKHEVEKLSDIKLSKMVVPDVMENKVVARVATKAAPEPVFNNPTDEFAKMSPSELKKAFKRTYLSENKHLSTYEVDERFDVISETAAEGFDATPDLSESGGVRPLEIKVSFLGDDASLSRDNYSLLSEYAAIVASNPKRAIQISMPASVTYSSDSRKLAAKRLAIIEQVLEDVGVSDQRIMPSLTNRGDDSFVLRVISSDVYETMTQQKKDMFGDTVGKKTYKSMAW